MTAMPGVDTMTPMPGVTPIPPCPDRLLNFVGTVFLAGSLCLASCQENPDARDGVSVNRSGTPGATTESTGDSRSSFTKSRKQTVGANRTSSPTKRVSSQQLLDFGFREIDRSEIEKEKRLPEPPAANDQLIDQWYYIQAPPTNALLELLGIDAGAGCLIADNAGPWLTPYRIDKGWIYAVVTREMEIGEAWIHRRIPKKPPAEQSPRDSQD